MGLSSYKFAPLAFFGFFRYFGHIARDMFRGGQTGEKYASIRRRCVADVFKSSGIRVETEDPLGLLKADKSRIYVMNHESFLDAVILIGEYDGDIRFLAKSPLFSVPFLGSAMRFERHIPVYRGKAKAKNRGIIDSLEDVFAEGGSVFFFPEGTRSTDGRLGEFKLGAFIASVRYGVPIVVVKLEGTGSVMPKGSIGVDNSGVSKIRVLGEVEAITVTASVDEISAAEAMRDTVRAILVRGEFSSDHGGNA